MTMRTPIFFNFTIKYLSENETFPETVFACSFSAQIESFKQKNGQKSRDTVLLRASPEFLQNLNIWSK